MKVWAKDTFSTYLIKINIEEGRQVFFLSQNVHEL